MSHQLTKAFRIQAMHAENLGSPFMARWGEMLAQYLTPQTDLGKVLFNWEGDVTASGDNVPLRLMGALHHLVLQDRCSELSEVYPPHDKSKTDAQLWEALQTAFANHAPAILRQLKSPPQTNEVRRSAILLPGFLTIADRTHNLPLVCSELGASAGLNLNWQHYHYAFGGQTWGNKTSPVTLAPQWKGPTPPTHDIRILERRGCDLNPTDLSDQSQITNLLSYLWADQPERITRTKAAFDLAAQYPYQVDKMDAIDWLQHRLSTSHEGAVHVIYHTIAWQYFPENLKRQGEMIIKAAGARATETAPLARLSFEADGQEPGGVLTLTMYPGGQTTTLARADYHGRWVNWVS